MMMGIVILMVTIDSSHDDTDDSFKDDNDDDPVDVDQALCEQGCASPYTLVQTLLQFEDRNIEHVQNYHDSGILDHKEYQHYHHPRHNCLDTPTI